MLKIKNNVDLKELENFGFEQDKDLDWYRYDLNSNSNVYVKPIRRQIILRAYSRNYSVDNHLDILYDLIKADLVEKVQE